MRQRYVSKTQFCPVNIKKSIFSVLLSQRLRQRIILTLGIVLSLVRYHQCHCHWLESVAFLVAFNTRTPPKSLFVNFHEWRGAETNKPSPPRRSVAGRQPRRVLHREATLLYPRWPLVEPQAPVHRWQCCGTKASRSTKQ